MTARRWTVLCALTGLLAVTGCKGSGDAPEELSDVERVETVGKSAALSVAKDCDDLLTRIQNDAVAKLDLEIEAFRKLYDRAWEAFQNGESFGGGFDDGARGGSDGGVDFTSADTAVPLAAPEMAASAPSAGQPAGGSGEGGAVGDFDDGGDQLSTPTGSGNEAGSGELGGGGGSEPTGASQTNSQFAEVDEPDFVKLVELGKRAYLLHGSDLFTLRTWEPEALAVQGEPVRIQGRPREMLNTGTHLVVFSERTDHDGEIFGQDVLNPWDARGATQVSVYDTSGETPSLLSEYYYEGSYTSARRHDAVVRVVMQARSRAAAAFDLESIEVEDPWGNPRPPAQIDTQLDALRALRVADIRATTLDQWLPAQAQRSGGEIVPLSRQCDSHYLPPAGLADYGLTRVVTLDSGAVDQPPRGVSVLGYSEVVYADLGHMLLAQPDYRWRPESEILLGDVAVQQTVLHQFALNGAATDYDGSGFVPGLLAGESTQLKQFALQIRDGVIFASTTGEELLESDSDIFTPWRNSRTINRLVSARLDDGALQVLDTTAPLGKVEDRETTRSTRFVGDRAYVVTFRNTDPLIVIDISDAAQLEVLGELEIPGFSQYMHPLGDDHLLTIGQGEDWNSIQLQIFDVSDDLNPRQAHVHDLGQGHTEAGYDHRAFTFHADRGLLAVPFVRYGGEVSSTLALFDVHVNEGIAPRGAIDHSGFYQTEPMPTCDDLTQAQRDRAFASHYGYDSSFTEQDVRELIPWVEEEEAYICATALGWEPQRYYWENPEIRRGLFVDSEEHTYVYSFSEGGVMVHDVDAPDAALGSASLPQAQWSESECYGCGDWAESDNGFGGQPVPGTPGGPDFDDEGWEGSGTTNVDPDPADPEPDVEEMGPEIDTIVPDDNGPADVKALCEETCGAGLGECAEDSRQHTSCYEDCVARAQRADGVCQSSLDRLLACCADNGGICRDGEPSVQEPFCAAVCPEASATFDLCIE